MTDGALAKIWNKAYEEVPETLKKIKGIRTAATAFNTNIDAVLKISGRQLGKLIQERHMSLADLENIKESKLNAPEDVLRGIFKCFRSGIAEEWLTEDKQVYQWMVENLKYERLQMGGQGGIVANVLAVAGVQKVYAHANSLPKLQAQQFLALENLVSFDEKGREKPAYLIDRQADLPLIHWIIEFAKGEEVTVDGCCFVCPKDNRFIATYDPLNLKLSMDKSFLQALDAQALDYVILSGYHALTAENSGVALTEASWEVIRSWKEKNPQGLIHLEIASTQDLKVRRAVVEKIAPRVDSVGLNERETIDVLRVIDEERLADDCEKKPDSVNLFRALLAIKGKVKTPRMQLHMFGLYLTLQNQNFPVSPEANRRGMMLAATVAAGKAGSGDLNRAENLLWAAGHPVADAGLKELSALAEYLGKPELAESGICTVEEFSLICVPTIIIDKPKTLVGMGDTISSMSLIGAR